MKEDRIELDNGDKIAATSTKADSDMWVFFCHGFGGNKERQSEYLELSERCFNVVTFDFRGNGESGGDFIDQNLSSRIQDLKAVVKHFDPERVVLFGTSFGGKVVFHAAEELDADGVVGKAPVTYNEIMDKFRDVVEKKGRFEYIDGKPIDRRFFEDLDNYNFGDVTGDLDMPVAIFHGSEDTTVHLEYSFKAARNMDTSVMLNKMEGEEHSFSEEGKEYLLAQIENWVESNKI